jgi:hypothetical protein
MTAQIIAASLQIVGFWIQSNDTADPLPLFIDILGDA